MRTEQPFIRWDWIWDHLDEIWERFVEHLALTGIAIGLGLIVAMPLAVYAYRHRWFYGPVTTVSGLLYAIPSLALIAALIPFTGLSLWTIEIPLVSYTFLILIRNTVSGLESVPEDVKEAARGTGYTDRQILLRVETPLALPVIVAGIRLATVSTIGLVTVGALIGQGGFGQFILDGFRRRFATASLVGAVLSLLLAITVDALLLLSQRFVTPWARRRGERVTG